jgi:hypothetical protein
MSSLPPGPTRLARPAGESDVYTVLLIISTLALLTATIYVAYRSVTQFGSLIPPAGG